MRWRIVALPIVVAVITSVGLAQPASASSSFTFNGPTKLPGSDNGTEPSLGIALQSTNVNPVGYRYPTWQVPGQFDGSADGVNFTQLTTPDPSASGDTVSQVDAAGAVYNAQICGSDEGPFFLHTCIWRSLDGAQTWPQVAVGADNNPGASDRPWIDVYPKQSRAWNADNTYVYLEYHTFTPDDLTYATVSTDGGATFGIPVPLSDDPNSAGSSFCSTIPSGIVADQRHPGTVYALWLSAENAVIGGTSGCNYTQAQVFNKAWVSVSTDYGLTWTAHLAWHGAYDPTTGSGDNASKIFGTITVDRSGQVHVMLPVRFNDNVLEFLATGTEAPADTKLVLVTSPDQAQDWTPAFIATRNCKGSHFYPWITGGSAGRLDAVYYHSDSEKPNDPTSVWYTSFLQVTRAVATVGGSGAQYTHTPVVKRTDAVDPNPVHVGGICTFGIFCSAVPNANRNLADSISIALTPDGGANLVWTKDTNPNDQSEVDFACQTSGPSAFANMPNIQGCF
jgi:hypothetical protein